VRASFELSYKERKEEEQRAFRLLGLLRAADFAAWVVSALVDCDLRDADDVVERLVDARLLEIAGEDATGRTRYRFHDLLRVFARERLNQEEPQAAQQASLKSLLGAYLSITYEADGMLSPDTFPPVDKTVVERWRPMNFNCNCSGPLSLAVPCSV